jgi:hypothetical protein
MKTNKVLILILFFSVVLFGFFIYQSITSVRLDNPEKPQGPNSKKIGTRIYLFSKDKTEEIERHDYLDLLIQKVKKSEVINYDIEDKCFQYWLWDNKDEFVIEVHEYHKGNCTGDPRTNPLRDTFYINKKTKEILWLDIINNKKIEFF